MRIDDYQGRVEAAQGQICKMRELVERRIWQIRQLAELAERNPLFRHTYPQLADAREALHQALDRLDPATIAYSLEAYYCVHCGRAKTEDQDYCSDECRRCATACKESGVPEGRPCHLICISKLGGSNAGM